MAGATERERSLAGFIASWQADDIPAALARAEAHAALWPRDLALVKLHHYLAFNLGDAPGMLRIALAVEPYAADVAQLHGMLAFAYEQCHLIGDAERSARRALAIERKEPWAQHALAHVALTEGRIAEGSAFLEAAQESWTGLNSFMLTHLWWHQALFYLSRGELERVLAIYDGKCWGISPDYSQDQIGAVSLLARIELAGLDVGVALGGGGRQISARVPEVEVAVPGLQYLYGLCRAGGIEARTLLAADPSDGRPAPVCDSCGLGATRRCPAAGAIAALFGGPAAAAVRGLRAALPRLVEIGGSHAQRDLFELIWLGASIADR